MIDHSQKHADEDDRQGLIGLAVVLALVILVVGYLSYRVFFDLLIDSYRGVVNGAIASTRSVIDTEILKSEELLRLVMSEPGVAQNLSVEAEFRVDPVIAAFTRYARNIDSVMQIRWLDEQGVERVRVDHRDDRVYRADEAQLQNKSGRYYVDEALKLPVGEIYVSDIDLNVENGQVEKPYRPTVRVILRTGLAQDQKPGLLIINYDFGFLLKDVPLLVPDVMQMQLVNGDGFWLYHPEDNLAWGHILGESQNNMAVVDPALWREIEGLNTEDMVFINRRGLAVHRMNLLHDDPTSHRPLFIVGSISETLLNRLWWKAVAFSAGASVLLCVIAGFLLYKNWRLTLEVSSKNAALKQEAIELSHAIEELDHALQMQSDLRTELIQSEKLASMGTMMAGMSHELNTPIGTSILTMSSLEQRLQRFRDDVTQGITKSGFDDHLASLEEGMKQALKSNQRAADLIAGFKRLAFDRNQDEVRSFHLHQVINDVMLAMRPMLRKAGVRLNIDVADDLEISSIPGMLSQVLQNLVNNALDHGLSGVSNPVLSIVAKLEGKTVDLIVSDNGRGIDAAILPHIFEPFVTSNRSGGNTGMGMYFVHQWVTQPLQGEISIEAVATGGTSVRCTIPVERKDLGNSIG